MLDPELLDAYRNANYLVRSGRAFTLQIGQHSPDLSQIYREQGVASAAFVTATNPHSQRLAETENIARQQALQSLLVAGHWRFLEGIAQDPTLKWPDEPSYLILGISPELAATIGRQFGQNAIVICPGTAIPELLILS